MGLTLLGEFTHEIKSGSSFSKADSKSLFLFSNVKSVEFKLSLLCNMNIIFYFYIHLPVKLAL